MTSRAQCRDKLELLRSNYYTSFFTQFTCSGDCRLLAALNTTARKPPCTAAKPATARAAAVTSIPQQYKVQQPIESAEAPAGAIYDTQPLAHPAKKKPGWLWAVYILVIALVGAGATLDLFDKVICLCYYRVIRWRVSHLIIS